MSDLHRHPAASEAIRHYIQLGRISHYPMYLLGLVMLEHRGGPALVTLLTLSDGRVLEARARSLRPRKREPALSDRFPYDVSYLELEDVERYQREFVRLGGFSSTCLEASPTAVANRLLETARHGLDFGEDVGPSRMGPPDTYPSDWTDIVYYSHSAITCSIEGFSPAPDRVDALDLPSWLKREMLIAHSPELHWLDGLETCLTSVDPRISGLVREAWHVRVVSPRASAVLLRTVAELVAAHLHSETGWLYDSINRLEAAWKERRAGSTPADRRDAAWESQVIASLDTIRDTGNQVHADSDAPSRQDLDTSHTALKVLLESVAHPRAWPIRIDT